MEVGLQGDLGPMEVLHFWTILLGWADMSLRQLRQKDSSLPALTCHLPVGPGV
jgi:hypothetical protein